MLGAQDRPERAGTNPDQNRLTTWEHGGTYCGVPLADEATRQRHERAITELQLVDVKHAVSALFAESGEIAPVDVARFGRRAGEIIADAAHHRSRRRFRRSARGHGAL